MDAVILAAGAGTRMNGQAASEQHKSLTSLMGMAVIERGIRAMRDCGIERVVVVTGHAADGLQKRLGDGRDRGIQIEYVYCADWERGNGASLYAARHRVRGNRFVLAMSDHWYEPALMERLMSAAESSGGNLLCVDREPENLHDPDDATRVRLSVSGDVLEIGKSLELFDAVDCGVFVLSNEIFPALERGFTDGDYSMTAGTRYLTAASGLQTVDVTGLMWEDVDTMSARDAAARKLRRSLTTGDDGLVSHHLNRRISIQLSRLAVRLRMTPNAVSIVAFGLAILAGISFGLGALIPGALLAQLSSIIDGSDGEVARARFMSSNWGGFFDSMLDRMADSVIYVGIGIYLMQDSGSVVAALAVFGALAGAPFSMMLKDRYRIMTGNTWRSTEADGLSRYMLATRDGRLFLVMIGGLTGMLLITTAYTAVATLALLAWRMVLVRRELHRSDTETPVTQRAEPTAPFVGVEEIAGD
jgi:CDP-L-myo-inositol myo-inositolphosphotransferase